jgi:hypothetical protein
MIVYYPDVPMLTQPIEVKEEEETNSPSRSSLANIGTDVTMLEKYDALFGDNNRILDKDIKTSSSETERDETSKDDILLDGDATPKVSRVRKPYYLL